LILILIKEDQIGFVYKRREIQLLNWIN